MSEELSSSCGVSQELRLGRSIIGAAMKLLRHSRVLQVTLGRVLCATRFKFFSREGRRPTMCSKCGQTDTYAHPVRCMGLGRAPTNPEELAAYLAGTAERACVANPGFPTLIAIEGDTELDLEPATDLDAWLITERGLPEEGLAFEDDNEVAFDVRALPSQEGPEG